MNNANVSQPGAQDYAVDVDNFQALNDNANMSAADKNSPQPQHKEGGDQQYNVKNVEDDGNGFFITGINTHDQQADDEQDEGRQDMQQIDEEDENSFDPADKYRHLAVVDCSKAFSNQEVSLKQIPLL